MEISERVEAAYVQRMSPELQALFTGLPDEARRTVLKAIIRFHEVMEVETFELVQGLLQARSEAKGRAAR